MLIVIILLLSLVFLLLNKPINNLNTVVKTAEITEIQTILFSSFFISKIVFLFQKKFKHSDFDNRIKIAKTD